MLTESPRAHQTMPGSPVRQPSPGLAPQPCGCAFSCKLALAQNAWTAIFASRGFLSHHVTSSSASCALCPCYCDAPRGRRLGPHGACCALTPQSVASSGGCPERPPTRDPSPRSAQVPRQHPAFCHRFTLRVVLHRSKSPTRSTDCNSEGERPCHPALHGAGR